MTKTKKQEDEPKIVASWTAEDFLERKFPPKEPLVQDLVHKRDLVAFGARRRHGKTTLALNLGVAGAAGIPEFLGYRIPQPFRSMHFMLEDDPTDLQERLRLMVGEKDLQGRFRLITKEDFFNASVPISTGDFEFVKAIEYWTNEHKPDLIVFDNLAQMINAEYSDPKIVHRLIFQAYKWARNSNCAVIFAAHPRKMDPKYTVSLESKPELFVEEIMGTSHFINSCGCIWALERYEDKGYTIFMGGRQRSGGSYGTARVYLDDDQWFQVEDDSVRQLASVLSTDARRKAWELLPIHPFGYREGQDLVKPVMRSSSTYHAWMKELKRTGVVVDSDSKISKAASLTEARDQAKDDRKKGGLDTQKLSTREIPGAKEAGENYSHESANSENVKLTNDPIPEIVEAARNWKPPQPTEDELEWERERRQKGKTVEAPEAETVNDR